MSGIVGCDDYDQFEEEMYDQMVYIVTNTDFNVYPLVCDMNSEKSVYGLSISVSGTTKVSQDIDIKLTKDDELLGAYNVVNFDSVSKYSLELPDTKFNIPSYTAKIEANSKHIYTLLPIVVEREHVYTLNPDSAYFIPLKIESVSHYSINENKKNTLIRIYPKNKYAETLTATNYNLSGEQVDINGVINNIFKINKPVTPLTNNTVRMNIGVLDADTKRLPSIQRTAMTVTISENNRLSIAPYAPDAGILEVEMLNAPSDYLYSNRFEEIPDPYSSKKLYQRFLLYYKYRNRIDTSKPWSDWVTVSESTSRDVYIE